MNKWVAIREIVSDAGSMSPMRIPLYLAASLTCLLSPSSRAAEALQSGDLVAICGDSITEQRLYSVFMQEYLLMCQPAEKLNAIQVGWSGEQAGGFAARFANDVAPFKATVGTTCYGMNDGGYKPVDKGVLDTYRRNMTQVVRQMKEAGMRFIVLGSPGVVDPAGYKRPNSSAAEYNETLKELGGVAKEVANLEGVGFADVFTPMMEGMTKAKAKLGEDYKIAPDGVHPTPNGQLAMAYAFLKALGCDGEIGTITFDMAAGKAESDPAQKILSVKDGVIEIESTRYPYCFTGKAGDSGTLAMAEFIPFNQDLNRYKLVVKNAPAKARVTWGSESREYTADELAKGVNLAADFQDHPFKAPFAKVTAEIRKQQDFEQKGIKGLLHSLIDWRALFPSDAATFDNMQKLILDKDESLRSASRAAVVPVTHTIKLEPLS